MLVFTFFCFLYSHPKIIYSQFLISELDSFLMYRKGVAPSPTSWFSSYRKGSLQVSNLLTYIYIYISSSSSSRRATSTDIPDPLSPLLPIIHRLWQVFRATSHILIHFSFVYNFLIKVMHKNITYIYESKAIVGRVFTNGPGDQGSIPGQVVPKTQKMLIGASLLNTLHYKVWIKSKRSNPGKGVAPFPTSWFSSYRKGSLQVPNLLTYMYIYHHHHPHVALVARISLTLSRHFSLSFIASGRSSGLHPISSQSCCMYARAGHPAFAHMWGSIGVHHLWAHPCFSSSVLHVWFV